MLPALQTAHPSSIPCNFCHTRVFDLHPLVVKPTTHIFLSERMLVFEDPWFLICIMSLCRHFIMCTKNASPFNIILWLNGKLHFKIPNSITNQTWLITFHGGEKFVLTVWQDISMVMAIKIQALFVRDEAKAFLSQPTACCAQWNLRDGCKKIIPPPYISLGPEVFLHKWGDTNIYQLHWKAVHSCWIVLVSHGSWPTCLSGHMPEVLQQ